MKTLSYGLSIIALFIGSDLSRAQVAGQSSQSSMPAPTPYSVVSSDANSSIWERTVYEAGPDGQIVPTKHRYTEISSGLNFQNPATGQWKRSKEEIDLLPDGTAAATNGQHQVYFPADIYNGQILLVTPRGQLLRSQPLGLSYDDGSNTVLIATLTNSIGELVSSNVLIYPNAFVGINADLRYSFTASGFEQDVILHSQPPAPESFNMASQNVRLQVLTEFFNPPQVSATSQPLSQAGMTLNDEYLDFGGMAMGRGRAFLMGTNRDKGTIVAKQWVNVSGRQILIEEVPLPALAKDLQQLPPSTTARAASPLNVVSAKRLLPDHPLAAAGPKGAIIARANAPDRGLVLDYLTINTGLNNYTFQANNTYYVTGSVNVSGTATFEGGTVIKANGSGSININGTIVCNTGQYRPAVFTSVNDNTAGETISVSTGWPSYGDVGTFLNINANNASVHDFRISYCSTAMYQGSGLLDIWNCQFIDTYVALNVYDLELFNDLFESSSGYPNIALGGDSLSAVNMTADSSGSGNNCFVYAEDSYYATVALTNCLITGQPILGNSGEYLPTLVTVDTVGAGLSYQWVGAGNYYLYDSTYRHCGTANLPAWQLAELAARTTWPPVVYSHTSISSPLSLSPQARRDNGSNPDLGYHYDPIDYVVDELAVNNTTLTVTNGAVLATYNEPGIQLENGGSMVSIGAPTAPNWLVRYQTVQEQSEALGTSQVSSGITVSAASGAGSGTFEFTRFSTMENGGYHFYDDGSSLFNHLVVQNSELYAGTNDFSGGSSGRVALLNDLFERSAVYASGAPAADYLAVSNCLFWGTTVKLNQPSGGNWYAFNNDFDSTTITSSTINNGYNAYLNCSGQLSSFNATDISSSTPLAYETGPFGNFYQPPTSPLIQMGSTTSDQAGLYEFTTQTNEIPETNAVVDLGYHYVATDQYGNPLDTYAPGIPNYVVDGQENGMDTNGLPFWWEGEYFFQVGLNPNSDPDDDGNDLLIDYQNGIDPDVFNFFVINVANNYVNTSSVPAQLGVTGAPYYIAISVDDPNYESDAAWSTYVSSNITVNVGSTAGWHNVWVGLRGHADAPTNAVWQRKLLKLDRTPPQIVVTNPAVQTVAVPIIQLQGYSPKVLSAISYDLTNANGQVTNQPIFITSQTFSTNTWEYTTNFFEGFDILLTNGLNTITIHATDMAGNVTTTNFSFTVDYASKTNPPLTQVYWPLNGQIVCGTNFLCQGWVGDPTVSVQAQLVDTNEDTNTFTANVGRDGRFWLENLPLNGGTNWLTLTMTDVVGNAFVTNLIILSGNAGLNIDPVAAGQTTVTGEINANSDTVWVNGEEATNDGNGMWTASIAPIGGAGGAVEAVAIPNSDHNGNGSGGTDAAGNPMPPDGQGMQIAVNAPQGIYEDSSTFQDDENWWYYSFAESIEGVSSWADNAGGWYGKQTYDAYDGLQSDYGDVWLVSPWPEAVPWGLETKTNNGQFCCTTLRPASMIFYEEWANVVEQDPVLGSSFSESAEGTLEFATGGELGSTTQRLYQFSGGVTIEHNPYPPDDDTVQWFIPWDNETVTDGRVSLGNLGNLDANGYVYALLADNTRVAVTPSVKGVDDYFDDPPIGFTQYTLTHLTECTAAGNTNNARTTVGIGEVVDFGGMPDGTTWTVSGAGSISPTNGNGTKFTASLNPGSATVTAQIDNVTTQTTFSVVAPDSISIQSSVDNPPNKNQNPNGTQMGAETDYVDIIGPTNVSFNNVLFRENPNPASVNITWPNNSNWVVAFHRSGWQMGCGQITFKDSIDSPGPLFATSFIYNGTSYTNFSFGNSWTDQYQNQAGIWTDFFTLTYEVEYLGSTRQCRVIYLGQPGGWQGPY